MSICTRGLVAMGLLSVGCGTTGREFLASKTGIDIPRPISVCASGVIDNDDCEPTQSGGSKWQRNTNFATYSVTGASLGDGSYQKIVAAVLTHYLGSPFYEGDVHANCKAGLPDDAVPATGTILQDFDLAAKLQETAVTEVASRLKAKLQARSVPAAVQIADDFKAKLSKDVASKIQARFLWIVARYPGGRADIEANSALKKCSDEVHGAGKASFVTGVAGYIILANRTSASISSESTVANAMSLSLDGKVEAGAVGQLTVEMGNEWKTSVDKVVHIDIDKQDLTTTAYPLWVQFE